MIKYLPFLVAAVILFFLGRFSAPEKVKIVTTTTATDQKTSSDDREKDKQKIITNIKKPDGTLITRTRYVTIESIIKNSSDTKATSTTVQKEITNRRGVVVSVLVGAPLVLGAPSLAYGVSISKEILGPINLGAWGITNKGDVTAGVSAGLEF